MVKVTHAVPGWYYVALTFSCIQPYPHFGMASQIQNMCENRKSTLKILSHSLSR